MQLNVAAQSSLPALDATALRLFEGLVRSSSSGLISGRSSVGSSSGFCTLNGAANLCALCRLRVIARGNPEDLELGA